MNFEAPANGALHLARGERKNPLEAILGTNVFRAQRSGQAPRRAKTASSSEVILSGPIKMPPPPPPPTLFGRDLTALDMNPKVLKLRGS